MDRNGSDNGSGDEDDHDTSRSGIYRPPRVAAMPYLEGPAKGKSFAFSGKNSGLIHSLQSQARSRRRFWHPT